MDNNVRNIRIEDYDYPLPPERIARYPLPQRDTSKLLHYNAGQIQTYSFCKLPTLLPHNALLISNNTKVIRARLQFYRATGGRIEVFCLNPVSPKLYEEALNATGQCVWHCLVGNAKKWALHEELTLPLPTANGATTLAAKRSGKRTNTGEDITFKWGGDLTFGQVLETLGELPIPPYLNRDTEQQDLATYQTVYAEHEGSVAAPTAGLHFTPQVLQALSQQGIQQAHVTLHVGAGTFRPVKSETMGEHPMHQEVIAVPLSTLQQLHKHNGPIVAVGTTSTRTLESLYYIGVHLLEGSPNPFHVGQWEPYDRTFAYTTQQALAAIINYLEQQGETLLVGATQIIIVPGFRYRLVEQLITNFHQPHSTLLLLIAAFVGESWRDIYNYALQHDYRFLSYGDSSLLLRNTTT